MGVGPYGHKKYFLFFQRRYQHKTSESDVYGRPNLTSQVDPRAERVKIIITSHRIYYSSPHFVFLSWSFFDLPLVSRMVDAWNTNCLRAAESNINCPYLMLSLSQETNFKGEYIISLHVVWHGRSQSGIVWSVSLGDNLTDVLSHLFGFQPLHIS